VNDITESNRKLTTDLEAAHASLKEKDEMIERLCQNAGITEQLKEA